MGFGLGFRERVQREGLEVVQRVGEGSGER